MSVTMLMVIMQSVVRLSLIMLSVTMLNIVMQSAVRLSVSIVCVMKAECHF
jgi:hypothetical protein